MASALASLASGIVNILSSPTTIPDPFGTLFKVGRISVLTGSTVAQIANIKAQQAERGIMIETKAEKTPQGRRAIGRITGAPHLSSQKGVPISVFGKSILAEHGEFFDFDENGNAAIINKRSAAVFNKELEGIKGLSFSGKREYLSGINSYKGFGIPFLQQGGLITPDIVTATSSSNRAPQIVVSNLSNDSIVKLAAMVGQAVKEGAKTGVEQGANTANRQNERERELREREAI